MTLLQDDAFRSHTNRVASTARHSLLGSCFGDTTDHFLLAPDSRRSVPVLPPSYIACAGLLLFPYESAVVSSQDDNTAYTESQASVMSNAFTERTKEWRAMLVRILCFLTHVVSRLPIDTTTNSHFILHPWPDTFLSLLPRCSTKPMMKGE